MSIVQEIESSPERMKGFQRERLEVEITELISRVMDEQGISRAELARRLEKSRPYITQLLSDGSNMTVRTISDIFWALGRSLRVIDRPLSVYTPVLFVMEAPSERSITASRVSYSAVTPSTPGTVSPVPIDQTRVTPEAA